MSLVTWGEIYSMSRDISLWHMMNNWKTSYNFHLSLWQHVINDLSSRPTEEKDRKQSGVNAWLPLLPLSFQISCVVCQWQIGNWFWLSNDDIHRVFTWIYDINCQWSSCIADSVCLHACLCTEVLFWVWARMHHLMCLPPFYSVSISG